MLITGASSGIGRATALKVAAAGGVPLLVARNVEKLEEVRAEIVAAGGTAYVYAADLSDMESIDRLVERVLADHRNVDMLVNNAGRSIRRSIALSYDRFHDFERTMQLNYFGAVKLIIGLLPHMRERGSGHIVNISSIGVQTNPPRFSAYVASKAALDAFTRVVASEVIGDGVTFTTIHMPLVRTPMIAPDEDVRRLPRDHARGGGGHDLRGAALAPEAHGHAPGDVRRGRLHAGAEGGRPAAAPRLPRVPRLRRLQGAEGRRGARLVRADRDGHADEGRALVGATAARDDWAVSERRGHRGARPAASATASTRRCAASTSPSQRGEVFGLLGPNGAGKTTTVEILEGYRERSGGEVSVLGHDPAQTADRAAPAHRDRAAVGRHLQPHHPARGAAPLGELLPAAARRRGGAELAGLEEKADVRSRKLSGGQLRRLDFALALVGDPELIFLDEPTTGFDPEARRAAWETVRSLRELGKTILLTTHYLDEAQALADRVAIVKDGRVLAIGPPRELGRRARRTTASPTATRAASSSSARPTTRRACCTSSPSEALARGERLEELSVGRPTLEDVYLELTADA